MHETLCFHFGLGNVLAALGYVLKVVQLLDGLNPAAVARLRTSSAPVNGLENVNLAKRLARALEHSALSSLSSCVLVDTSRG